MKRFKYSLIAILVTFAGSCGKNFLENKPQGQILNEQLGNDRKSVEYALIGAYALLNGNINGTWGNYSTAPSQWVFGEIASDNSHKGSSSGDQSPMSDIELHKVATTNDNLPNFWRNNFEGIIRCNLTLQLLQKLQSGDASDKFSEQRANEVEGEARMLRAHYYFFLRRVFVNVPYIDEKVTSTDDAVKTPNDKEIYPMIEEDLKIATQKLDYVKPNGEAGRCDKYAASSYLAKVYLYQKKYSEALKLFKEVITKKPALTTLPYQNNFDITTENGPECIFTVQHIINPDGSGDNANVGDMLSGLYGTAPINCCGFHQPSIDLVNAFKVNANGLPLLDNSYRTNPYISDMGLTGSAKTNYKLNQTIAFDPRLDYTVGRRGAPFLDWGIFPGDAWIRDAVYAGAFVGKKPLIKKANFSGNTVSGEEYVTGLNVNLIRLADVYLMAAECAAETGDLAYALQMVNAVRARAAKLPPLIVNGQPAAAYNVKPYPSFPTPDYAKKAIRFERRLELGMEGHRFYDLVRWDMAKQVLEEYMEFEKKYTGSAQTISFKKSNNYFPIPQQEIDRSASVLKQNEGY